MNIFRTILISIFTLCAGHTAAFADAFSFSDMKGFDACLSNTHMVESTNTKMGKQTKYLSKIDIQERCFKVATKHLKNEKSAKVIGAWVKVGRKHSHRANAIDLMGLQAKQDPSSCNDDAIYDTILNILAGPSSKDEQSLYVRNRNLIHTCLKDKQFKQDFMDEQDSSKGSYQYTNVCEVLKGKKLIKKCFKG